MVRRAHGAERPSCASRSTDRGPAALSPPRGAHGRKTRDQKPHRPQPRRTLQHQPPQMPLPPAAASTRHPSRALIAGRLVRVGQLRPDSFLRPREPIARRSALAASVAGRSGIRPPSVVANTMGSATNWRGRPALRARARARARGPDRRGGRESLRLPTPAGGAPRARRDVELCSDGNRCLNNQSRIYNFAGGATAQNGTIDAISSKKKKDKRRKDRGRKGGRRKPLGGEGELDV